MAQRQEMENERRRRENMRTVLASGRYRSAAELARALGITKGSLSQLVGSNPVRTISEHTARKWEAVLGLADGALDTVPVRPSPPPGAPRAQLSAPVPPPPGTAEQILDDVMRAVDGIGVHLTPEKYRAAVRLLYRLASRSGGAVHPADVTDVVALASP